MQCEPNQHSHTHASGAAQLSSQRAEGGGDGSAPAGGLFVLPDDGVHLESLEEDLIRQALRKADGNKTRAASLLGITRRTLYSRLERMGWTAGDDEV